jgi:CDP-diacylglycerol pyrophosphatase
VNQLARFLALLAIVASFLWPLLSDVIAADRDILWQVVQACVANHRVTGAAFSCLQVKEDSGSANGFVTLRAPLERTHIAIVPTARIEDTFLHIPIN